MAKFKFSPLVEQARGKFGNAVFSANLSGAYLRKLVQPRNPKTLLQSSTRATFGNVAQGWRRLTQAQRDLWKQYATQFSQTDILGYTLKLSGFQLYTKLNNSLQQIGVAGIDEPQGIPEFTPYGFQVEAGEYGPVVNNDDPDMEDNPNIALVYSLAGPYSVGRSTVSDSEFRQIAVMPGIVMANFPMQTDKPGSIQAIAPGQTGKFFIKMEQVDRRTGWRKEFERMEFIAEADQVITAP